MSRLLTVFGATGQQGGSLINYVLNNPELSKIYRLRGITRDIFKPASVALKKRGVEVIQANQNEPSTLAAAVEGSYAVFAVTNYWEQASAAVEIAQGKAMADASVAARVTLLIWSSLPIVMEMSKGAVTFVEHFDSKAAVETYIRGLPIAKAFFMAGWYMQNHIHFMPPKPKDDGGFVLAQTWGPAARVPMLDITDTGKFLAPILLDPVKYDSKAFTCATGFYTPLELVDGWTKVTGKKVLYEQSGPAEANRNLTAEMQHKLMKMLDDSSYFGPTGMADLKWTLAQMKEAPTSWVEFLRANEPWFSDVKSST